MGCSVERITAHREDLGPKQLFQLNVFFGDQEERLLLISVDFVVNCIGDHLFQDAFLRIVLGGFKEELVGVLV